MTPNPSFQRTRKQRCFACRLRAAEFCRSPHRRSSTAIVVGFGYSDGAAGCSQGGANVGEQRQTESS